jgi:beta-lactamase class A
MIWVKRFLPPTLIFLVGIMFGFYGRSVFPFSLGYSDQEKPFQSSEMREMGQYQFVNPLLECDSAQGVGSAHLENFQGALEEKIEAEIDRGDAAVIAVYFRDLNNGLAFGVNEHEKFIPASLLKVPVMMTYYYEAEKDPMLLLKKLRLDEHYGPPQVGTQHIVPEEEIQVGKEYAIEDLIRGIIFYSDNQAVTLLIKHISAPSLRKLYYMLGVDDRVLRGPDGRLSVHEYAKFFRILFNASYISPQSSEKALKLLTQTKFNNGLVAGVPEGVVVAHKFGEGGDEQEHQIHDCGIVYYPDHPYLLCVMTRGKSITTLEATIAEISHFVYLKIAAEYMNTAPSMNGPSLN